jgi:tetratricopeptide (TPR) repeat protein
MGSAQAAVTTFGNGQARQCFLAAEKERNPLMGVETCTGAIDNEALNLRDLAATHVNRGILHMRLKNQQRALDDFDQAIRMMPALADAYINRAVLLVTMGQDEQAITDATRGIELGAIKPQLGYYTRAVARELRGQVREAFSDYTRAAELAPDWTLPRDQLSRFRVVGQSDTPRQQQP